MRVCTCKCDFVLADATIERSICTGTHVHTHTSLHHPRQCFHVHEPDIHLPTCISYHGLIYSPRSSSRFTSLLLSSLFFSSFLFSSSLFSSLLFSSYLTTAAAVSSQVDSMPSTYASPSFCPFPPLSPRSSSPMPSTSFVLFSAPLSRHSNIPLLSLLTAFAVACAPGPSPSSCSPDNPSVQTVVMARLPPL